MKRNFFDSRKNKLGVALLLLGVIMAYGLKATFPEWTLYTVAIAGGMGFGMQNDKIIEKKGALLDGSNNIPTR